MVTIEINIHVVYHYIEIVKIQKADRNEQVFKKAMYVI